ncbi:MAG TPA: alpha-ketoglutarate-dependent dioxygenase AlkB [Polyangiaceae bacterium]|nr:alpha-ketoglutarate-dependent dioxygenase AlkB [Polyangiaceae bacterium]
MSRAGFRAPPNRPRPAPHVPQAAGASSRASHATPNPSPFRPRRERRVEGHHYFEGFVRKSEHEEFLGWLHTLRPLWEYRYAGGNGASSNPGAGDRRLLRPVYWLGNWQFACLDYYRPPHGVRDRCVQAEPFPPLLRHWVKDIEQRIQRLFPPAHIPPRFHLNTCLVNFYGNRLEDGRWQDCARVGEHRDFEPGPVASISIGERALIQFVLPRPRGERAEPLLSQWLDDASLQIFGGPLLKDRALHRVQRVDRRAKLELPPAIQGFSTRRVNLTFRYVPDEHIVPFERLGEKPRGLVQGYVAELAQHSEFFKAALERVRARDR